MLRELLPLKPALIVALVGAGGKTTTMFRLASERAARGERVITTTTTYIFPPTPKQTEMLVLAAERAPLLEQCAAALTAHQQITAAAGSAPEGKLRGLRSSCVSPSKEQTSLLARAVRNWKQALLIFQPDPLLKWHRQMFRWSWRR